MKCETGRTNSWVKFIRNAAELVGNTPLLEVGNIEKDLGLEAKVLVKLEYFNPAGSAKDRIALSMIEDAEEKRYSETWRSNH